MTQPLVDDGTGTGTLQSPVTQTVYDASGNVAATINPRNARWDYTFDERNRRVTEQAPAMVDPADGVSRRPLKRTGYDRVGNVVSMNESPSVVARANIYTNTPLIITDTVEVAASPVHKPATPRMDIDTKGARDAFKLRLF